MSDANKLCNGIFIIAAREIKTCERRITCRRWLQVQYQCKLANDDYLCDKQFDHYIPEGDDCK